MMIRVFRVAVVAVAIVFILAFAGAGIYVEKMTEQKVHDIGMLAARKDDMLAEQRELESEIRRLNATLASSIKRNEELSETLSLLAEELNQTVSAPREAPAPTAPAPPEITQAPVVTRAS